MVPHDNDYYPHAPGLSVSSQDDYTVATISGDLDIARVPVLREQLLGVLGPHASWIVIDLSWVTFCDASATATELRRALEPGRERLAAGQGRVRGLPPSRYGWHPVH